MAASLSHHEIEELLGAYALDAVEADEAVEVADHLVECARCRAEVAEHREVAALLAHGGADAPAEVWSRIAAVIEGSAPGAHGEAARPPSALFSSPRARRAPSRSWASRAFAPIVAVAAAVIAVLAFQVVEQGNRIDRQGEQLAAMSEQAGLRQAFQAAMAEPDATLVSLTSDDGGPEAQVVLADSTGYLQAAGLPELPEDRTYQLWADLGNRRISLGVLGNRPDVATFEMSDGVTSLAVTEEQQGGVVRTTKAPLVFARMPSER